MTGYDAFKRVCSLLGYELISNEDKKSAAFCGMLNQIAEDLGLDEIKSLSDPISLTPRSREALIYGSAMLFATALGDTGCADIYSTLYGSKRSAALSAGEQRQDVLPRPRVGGI